MVQIIQRKPNFGEIIGQGIGQGLGKSANFLGEMKLQQAKQKTEKLEEKRRGYEVALGNVQAMRSVLPKLGPMEAITSPIDSMSARQSYTSYANSLLGILSTIPVRNQKEFEAVKETLANPLTSTQNKIAAAIDSAEDIIKRHIQSLGGRETAVKEEVHKKEKKSKSGKIYFNENNPEHQAKAKQLMKTYKDIDKVRKELKREFEGVDAE